MSGDFETLEINQPKIKYLKQKENTGWLDKLINNIEEKKLHLNDALIQQKLLEEKIDITLENDHEQYGSLHPLSKTIDEVEKILQKTKEKFSKNRIRTSTKLIDGTPVNSIIDYAKDNSIIILGVSPKNSIMKYFFGSKPLSIAQKCNCPVLITK